MEHHGWVNINAPPQREARFCFELGLMWGAHTHIMSSPKTRNRTQVHAIVSPRFTIEISHYLVGLALDLRGVVYFGAEG